MKPRDYYKHPTKKKKKKKNKKNKGHQDFIFITGALEEKKILPKTTEQITYKIHNMKQSLNLFQQPSK